MGHEKAARLPFCTCPCDILSGVSMYVAYSVQTVVLSPLPTSSMMVHPFSILSAYGCCINFCIYAMLRVRATFSWPILYKGSVRTAL